MEIRSERPGRHFFSWRLLFLVLIAGGLVLLAVERLAPQSATQAAAAFADAARSGSFEKISMYLSAQTLDEIGRVHSDRHIFALRWQRILTRFWDPKDSSFHIEQTNYESNTVAVVNVKLDIGNPRVAALVRSQAPGFGLTPIVMVQEKGRWKFDSSRTMAHLIIGPQLCSELDCSVD